MSQPDSNKYTPPSRADLLLMAKLFSLGADGAWVREVDAQTSEPARRALHNWVRKGYAYYTQCDDTGVWLLVLKDDCARMCWETIASAFEVRVERSMRDMQKRKHHKLSPSMWAAAAALTAVILGLLVASVLL